MSLPNMNTAEAQQAPACFGASSCYTGNSKICNACGAYETCGEEVKLTLTRIKDVINVDDLLHKHNQALAKARTEKSKKQPTEPKEELVKPERAMPNAVERTSKVEKISYEISEETQTLIGSLPVKAQPFATQLCKTGLVDKIKKDLSAGLNPLEKTGPKFLCIALTELINGGFTKAQLRKVYVDTLAWSENSAASHVSLVVRLFAMFEIAIETDSKFVANPALLNQTI